MTGSRCGPFDSAASLRATFTEARIHAWRDSVPDGTFYLPDFTIILRSEEWYWEHLGMLHKEKYRNHWDTKKAWYEKHGFANRLITTSEIGGFDSKDVAQILTKLDA
ncbi:MAG TPA: hypothetical protein ENN19_05010 [Chloroflexi bacterium]|nr:hypothetical protein [Chloroflexota bacterium]